MKEKKVPLRRCVVSNERLEKAQLIRVVRTPEGNVIVDTKGKTNGRGAYLKKDLEVLAKAKRTKILEKHLEVSVPDTVYTELEEIIKNEK